MSPTATPLGFRLLGELEVEGVPRPMLGGPKQRALLAYLLLHANELVPRDRLVDAVWGESAPPTARSIVQGYIHKLRMALDESPAKIVTRSGGYVLEVQADELDARRFERLAVEGREALAAGDPERAQRLFGRALALWRGEPLADLTYEPAVEAEARRLSDLWLEATMDRIDAQIALGGAVPLLGELESLVSRHPLSERLRGQLMLAYYRAGRQAEALNTYRETRRLLVEELGLEPSAELRELERAILAQEVDGWGARADGAKPSVGGDAVDDPRAARRRTVLGRLRRLPRKWALVVGATVVAAIAIAALVAGIEWPSTATITVPPNAIGLIDPKANKVVATAPFPGGAGAVAAGAGSLWVGSLTDQTITIVDPQTRAVQRTRSVNTYPSSVAFGAGAVWVFEDSIQPDQAAAISRISPDGTVARHPIPKGSGPSALGGHNQNTCGITGAGQQRSKITVGEGRVWFACVDGTLGSFDPRSNRMQIGTYEGRGTPTGIAVNSDGVWVTDLEHNLVMRIEPSTHKTLQTFALDGEPRGIVATPGSVWVTNFTTDNVSRIDLPGRGLPAKQTEISVGRGPTAITYDQGAVWVANDDKTISRIDPESNRVTATIPIGRVPAGIAAGDGRVWVTAGQ